MPGIGSGRTDGVEGCDIAVVFPAMDRRGGVERVCWDLLEFLASRHRPAFVGSSAADGVPDGVRWSPVPRSGLPGPARLYVERARAARALGTLRPGVAVSMGAVTPPTEVLWVHSVHRAWLEAARTVRLGRFTLPAAVRFAMPRHRVLLAMEAEYFRKARPRRILCTSDREVADLGRYYGVDPGLTTVVPNPFDPLMFHPGRRERERVESRRELGASPDQRVLLFVANELHRKGLGQLLEAIARIGDPSLHLHTVGRAPLDPFRALIEQLGLAGQVHEHGPSADVGHQLAGADLLVLPTQYEPFGLVIVEALASGVPVLTSRLAGASTAVRPGRTGLLLEDPYDVDQLAGLLAEAAAADLDQWGREAARSVDDYRRDHVLARVESILFGEPG